MESLAKYPYIILYLFISQSGTENRNIHINAYMCMCVLQKTSGLVLKFSQITKLKKSFFLKDMMM